MIMKPTKNQLPSQQPAPAARQRPRPSRASSPASSPSCSRSTSRRRSAGASRLWRRPQLRRRSRKSVGGVLRLLRIRPLSAPLARRSRSSLPASPPWGGSPQTSPWGSASSSTRRRMKKKKKKKKKKNKEEEEETKKEEKPSPKKRTRPRRSTRASCRPRSSRACWPCAAGRRLRLPSCALCAPLRC